MTYGTAAMFQVSLPIEDLSRLKVFAVLTESGQPVLSLTLQSSPPSQSAAIPSSGIYVSFERSLGENGCWSLAMNTNIQEKHGDTRSCPPTPPTVMMMSSTPGSIVNDPFNNSVLPSFANSPVLSERSEIATEASSLLNWLDSQNEITAVDKDSAVDLGAAFSFSQPTLAVDQTSAYDNFFQGIFPTDQLHRVTPHIEPSSSSELSLQCGDSDSSSSQSDQQKCIPKTKRRNLPCLDPTCSQRFLNEHTRKKHMQAHRSEERRRLFACTMGCSEQFSRRHDRLRHEVSQHGYRSEWTCDECRGFFSSEKSRNSHRCTKGGGRWKIGIQK